MSFVPAVIDHSGKSERDQGSGIKVGIRGRVTPRLFIKIARSVGANLGLIDGTPIEVLIGEGEHHGLIRIRKHDAGVAYVEDVSSRGNGHFQIRLGRQARFVARTEAPQTCSWKKVEDGFIELKLPRWAAETGPKMPSVRNVEKAKRQPSEPVARHLNVRIEEKPKAQSLPTRNVIVQPEAPVKAVQKRQPAAPDMTPLNAFKKPVTRQNFTQQRSQATTRALCGDPPPGRSALDQRGAKNDR